MSEDFFELCASLVPVAGGANASTEFAPLGTGLDRVIDNALEVALR